MHCGEKEERDQGVGRMGEAEEGSEVVGAKVVVVEVNAM